jgi:hypothetical protein
LFAFTRAALAVAILLAVTAPAAAAHGGFPGLIAEPDPVNPGGTVEIRGDNLGSDEAVEIVVINNRESIALVAATTDGEGHLTVIATMPADLPVGRYTIQARTEGGYAAGGTVELAGVPIVDQGANGDPYERGPIGVIPSAATSPATLAGGGPVAPPPLPSRQPTVASDAFILGAALLLPIAIVVGLVARRRRAVAGR